MPRQAPRGGPRPLTRQWSVRLLACRFEIAVDCERLAAWLDVMLSRATQRYPVSRVHRFAWMPVSTTSRAARHISYVSWPNLE